MPSTVLHAGDTEEGRTDPVPLWSLQLSGAGEVGRSGADAVSVISAMSRAQGKARNLNLVGWGRVREDLLEEAAKNVSPEGSIGISTGKRENVFRVEETSDAKAWRVEGSRT